LGEPGPPHATTFLVGLHLLPQTASATFDTKDFFWNVVLALILPGETQWSEALDLTRFRNSPRIRKGGQTMRFCAICK